MWTVISSLPMLGTAIARSSQMWTNFKNDSTGQLSGLTLIFLWFIVAARWLSLYLKQEAFMYQLVYIHGVFWMTSLCLQFLYLNTGARKVKQRGKTSPSR